MRRKARSITRSGPPSVFRNTLILAHMLRTNACEIHVQMGAQISDIYCAESCQEPRAVGNPASSPIQMQELERCNGDHGPNSVLWSYLGNGIMRHGRAKTRTSASVGRCGKHLWAGNPRFHMAFNALIRERQPHLFTLGGAAD